MFSQFSFLCWNALSLFKTTFSFNCLDMCVRAWHKTCLPSCSEDDKLKLTYLGPIMRRLGSLKKTIMLGEHEGRRERGRPNVRWIDSIQEATGWVSRSGAGLLGTGHCGRHSFIVSPGIRATQWHITHIKAALTSSLNPMEGLTQELASKPEFFPLSTGHIFLLFCVPNKFWRKTHLCK